MREIKFRAWDKENEVMIYPKGVLFDGRVVNFSCGMLEPFEGYELMQFTGLYDKHHKPIYEGDIVSYFGLKYEVLFKNGAFGWMEDGEFYSFNEMARSEFNKFEIIGNVYENPELLEGTV